MDALKHLEELATTVQKERMDVEEARLKAAQKAKEDVWAQACTNFRAAADPLLASLRASPPVELAPLLAAESFFGNALRHWRVNDGTFEIRASETSAWVTIPLSEEQQPLIVPIPALLEARNATMRDSCIADDALEWFKKQRGWGHKPDGCSRPAILADLIRAKDPRLDTTGMDWRYSEGWVQNIGVAVHNAMDAARNEWIQERSKSEDAYRNAGAEVVRRQREAVAPIRARIVAAIEAAPEFWSLTAALELLSGGAVAVADFRRAQAVIALEGLDGCDEDPVLHVWPLETAPGADDIREYWATYDSFTQPKWTFRAAPTKSEVFAAMVERQDPALFAALVEK